MGFTYGWTSQAAMLAELLEAWNGGAGRYRAGHPIAHELVGNEFWSVWEYTTDTGEQVKEIRLDLLERIGGQWGHKPMGEIMGPYYYGCPLKYLELAPQPPGAQAATWRAKVRQLHKAKEALGLANEAHARALHGARLEHERRCKEGAQ